MSKWMNRHLAWHAGAGEETPPFLRCLAFLPGDLLPIPQPLSTSLQQEESFGATLLTLPFQLPDCSQHWLAQPYEASGLSPPQPCLRSLFSAWSNCPSTPPPHLTQNLGDSMRVKIQRNEVHFGLKRKLTQTVGRVVWLMGQILKCYDLEHHTKPL